MKAKHRRTLETLFATPTRGGIVFSDIEAFIIALGGDVREGKGSRVAFELIRKPKIAPSTPSGQRSEEVSG